MSRLERQKAFRLGRRAESFCVWRLRLTGWRVLARRYAAPGGEIDILAKRGATLATIEVKARAERVQALEAITPRQRRRIERAASIFLAQNPKFANLAVRFDVMLVVPWRLPHHIADAWRP